MPTAYDLSTALGWQEHSLQVVSRTFALTIPCLPEGLRAAVGNGYLLCRIADTIEDDPGLDWSAKTQWQRTFMAVLQGQVSAEDFAQGFGAVMAAEMPAAEHELIAHTPTVLSITRSFNPQQQAALTRCVAIMGEGMAAFQQRASRQGLKDQADMDRYCYVVAGVVGEMLTTLFVDHEPRLAPHAERMQALAVAFGQGLQMTNILKDLWTDWDRGVSWLPRDRLIAHGCAPEALRPGMDTPQFRAFMAEMLELAGQCLQSAMEYTLLIPADQPGMRDFCLWAIAMAVLTLRRIAAQPGFCSAEEVKISRDAVYRVVALSRLLHRSNTLLTLAFRVGAKPLATLSPAGQS